MMDTCLNLLEVFFFFNKYWKLVFFFQLLIYMHVL